VICGTTRRRLPSDGCALVSGASAPLAVCGFEYHPIRIVAGQHHNSPPRYPQRALSFHSDDIEVVREVGGIGAEVGGAAWFEPSTNPPALTCLGR
jgi:hypothetical protein